MLNFENMSRPEMIAARRTIRDNLDTLTAIYKDTCTGNPRRYRQGTGSEDRQRCRP